MYLPLRPGRRMPQPHKIAEYWCHPEREHVFGVEYDRPECFGCRRNAPEWSGSYFDRAHLVDRVSDGLDVACNLALLCTHCHRQMPSFNADEGPSAIEWVTLPPLIFYKGRWIKEDLNLNFGALFLSFGWHSKAAEDDGT